MTFRLLLILSLGGLSTAIADAPQSLELDLTDVRLPVSESGTFTFRACSSCQFQRAMAAPGAAWVLNRRNVDYEDLREGAASAINKSRSLVTLTFDKSENRITALSVKVRNPRERD